MAEKTKAIQVIKSYDISKPEQISKMANVVKAYVVKNNLYAQIAGKNYVLVEGWQFAGGLMGLFPKIVKVELIAPGKWLAQADIILKKDGSVVSSGFAICSQSENKKSGFDEYAILSMAQTRAIGKAFRNMIGWVMKLAGYEATPAEEIKGKTTPIIVPDGGIVVADSKKIEELKTMLKGKTDAEKLADLKKRTGMVIKDFKITERHAGILIASLLNSETK